MGCESGRLSTDSLLQRILCLAFRTVLAAVLPSLGISSLEEAGEAEAEAIEPLSALSQNQYLQIEAFLYSMGDMQRVASDIDVPKSMGPSTKALQRLN